MRKLLARMFSANKQPKQNKKQDRKELEKRVVQGAEKALKDYRQVFERLSDYDRAEAR